MTHELLGTIKGANAEVEMLKAALIDMTAQRDARMDMSALAAMQAGSGMSAADVEEFQTLKVRKGGEGNPWGSISSSMLARGQTYQQRAARRTAWGGLVVSTLGAGFWWCSTFRAVGSRSQEWK